MQQRGPPSITKSPGLALTPARTATVPAPRSFVSNAPSAFYRQHHSVEAPAMDERAFRPFFQVKSKLMLLLACERIDRRQLEAAFDNSCRRSDRSPLGMGPV